MYSPSHGHGHRHAAEVEDLVRGDGFKALKPQVILQRTRYDGGPKDYGYYPVSIVWVMKICQNMIWCSIVCFSKVWYDEIGGVYCKPTDPTFWLYGPRRVRRGSKYPDTVVVGPKYYTYILRLGSLYIPVPPCSGNWTRRIEIQSLRVAPLAHPWLLEPLQQKCNNLTPQARNGGERESTPTPATH